MPEIQHLELNIGWRSSAVSGLNKWKGFMPSPGTCGADRQNALQCVFFDQVEVL